MQEELKEKYNLSTALALVIGVVVGVGIFFKATPVLRATGVKGNYALFAWFFAVILTIIAAIVIAEVASMGNKTGGIMSFGEQAWGEAFGFLAGYVQTAIYTPLILAVTLYYCAIFTCSFLQIEANFIYLVFFSSLYFVFFGFANLLTKNLGANLQLISTIIKLLPLIAIAIYGIFFSSQEFVPQFTNISLPKISFFHAVAAALIPILFALDGWIFVTTISHEIKNPQKNLALAMIGGLIIVGIIYIAFNFALLNIAKGEVYASNALNINQVANILFGSFGAKMINFFILISALGAFNGFLLLGMRMPYSLALRRDFFASNNLLKVSSKNNIPINSGIAMLALIFIYMLIGFILLYNANETNDFKNIFDLFGDIPIVLMWIIYAFIFLGVLRLRKTKPKAKRLIKIKALPLFVFLALAGTIYAVYGFLISNFTSFIFSLFIAIFGLVIFAFSKKR